MARIISDSYIKGEKQIWGDDPKDAFNQKILAVNNMYGWLYQQGILEKVSFVFKDYAEGTHFALNAKDLEPYRREMEECGAESAALAVHHIFDEEYTPCVYSGAITLGWTMSTYRDVDGCVGRSWECDLIKCLNTEGIYDIANIRDEQGVKAAVVALYSQFDWNPTLQEEQARQADAPTFVLCLTYSREEYINSEPSETYELNSLEDCISVCAELREEHKAKGSPDYFAAYVVAEDGSNPWKEIFEPKPIASLDKQIESAQCRVSETQHATVNKEMEK